MSDNIKPKEEKDYYGDLLQKMNSASLCEGVSLQRSPTILNESHENSDEIKKNDADSDAAKKSLLFYKNAVQNMDENSVPVGANAPAKPNGNLADKSLEELLQSKDPLQRTSGYNRLQEIFEKKDLETINKFSNEMLRVAEIANPKLLKAGTSCLLSFIKNAPKDIIEPLEEKLMDGIVVKQLGVSKHCLNGVKIATALLSSSNDRPKLLNSVTIKGLKSRKPMAVNGCATLLKEVLSAHGPKLITPSFYQQWISHLFESTHPEVRKNAMSLACEMHRWGGGDFLDLSLLSKLKKSQIKAIESELSKIPPNSARKNKSVAKKTKNLKIKDSEKDSSKDNKSLPETQTHEEIETAEEFEKENSPKGQMKKESESNEEQYSPDESDGEIEYSLAETDVLKSLGVNKEWLEELGSGSWQCKKNMVTKATEKAMQCKRICPGEQSPEFFEVLERLLGDSNVNVVLSVLNLIPAFSRGMGKSFEPWAKRLLPKVMSKFKEKKNIQIACFEALDVCVENSITLENLNSPIEKALSDKAPKVRECILSWLVKCSSRKERNFSYIKTCDRLAEFSTKLLEDSAAPVRRNSYSLLAALITAKANVKGVLAKLKKKNEKAYKRLFKLNGVKEKDIEEKVHRTTKTVKTPQKSSKRRNSPKNGTIKTLRKPNLMTLKFPSKKTNKYLTLKKGVIGGREVKTNKDKNFKKLRELIGENVLLKILDSDSETICDGLEEMTVAIQSQEEIDEYCECLLTFLSEEFWTVNGPKKTKTSEGIVRRSLEALLEILQRSSESLAEKDLSVFLPFVLREMGRAELKDICRECMNVISEILGPETVLRISLGTIHSKCKTAKDVLQMHSLLEWVDSLFDNFAVSYFDDLPFVVRELEAIYINHKNVKPLNKLSCKVIETVFAQMRGDCRKKAAENMRSSLRPLILQKFNTSAKNEKLFAGSVLEGLRNEKSWQRRYEALKSVIESLNEFIDSEERLESPEIEKIESLLKVIKKLLDGRIVIVTRHSLLALRKIALLATLKTENRESIGIIHFSMVDNELFACLGVSNKQVQQETLQTVHEWVKVVGIEAMISRVSETLPKSTLVVKKALMKMIQVEIQTEDLMQKKKCYRMMVPIIVALSKEKDGLLTRLVDKIFKEASQCIGSEPFKAKARVSIAFKAFLNRHGVLNSPSAQPDANNLEARSFRTLRAPLKHRSSLEVKSYMTIKPKGRSKTETVQSKPRKEPDETDRVERLRKRLERCLTRETTNLLFSNDETRIVDGLSLLTSDAERFPEEKTQCIVDVFQTLGLVAERRPQISPLVVCCLDGILRSLETIGKKVNSVEICRMMPLLLENTAKSGEGTGIVSKIAGVAGDQKSLCLFLVKEIPNLSKDAQEVCLDVLIKMMEKRDEDEAAEVAEKLTIQSAKLFSSGKAKDKALKSLRKCKNILGERFECSLGEVSLEDKVKEELEENLRENVGERFKWDGEEEEKYEGDFVLPEVFILDMEKLGHFIEDSQDIAGEEPIASEEKKSSKRTSRLTLDTLRTKMKGLHFDQ